MMERTVRAIAIALLAAGLAAPAVAETVAEKLPLCLACHGENGRSSNETVPSLGAMPSPYTLIQLYMYREKLRLAFPMNDLMKEVSDEDLQSFADTIAKLPAAKPLEDAGDPKRMAAGRALAERNHCNICHRADFAGQENVPRIAGQREDYMLKTLRAYKSGERHGYDTSMADVIQPLSDADFVELAYFLAHVR